MFLHLYGIAPQDNIDGADSVDIGGDPKHLRASFCTPMAMTCVQESISDRVCLDSIDLALRSRLNPK
jgi:hypothetical protein